MTWMQDGDGFRVMVIQVAVPDALELTDEAIELFADLAADGARRFLTDQRDAVPT